MELLAWLMFAVPFVVAGAVGLGLPLLAVLSYRRLAWGLGRERSLFQDPLQQRFERLEPVLAHLRHRFPDQVILPGWVGKGA